MFRRDIGSLTGRFKKPGGCGRLTNSWTGAISGPPFVRHAPPATESHRKPAGRPWSRGKVPIPLRGARPARGTVSRSAQLTESPRRAERHRADHRAGGGRAKRGEHLLQVARVAREVEL